MRYLFIAALLTAGLSSGQQIQQGVPARATPADYQTAVKAGAITIAADFTEHSVTTPDSVYPTEDYIAFEVGLFGAPGAHVVLSPADFKLRINGKKAPLDAAPCALVFHSLKDPEWEQSVAEEKIASKTKIGASGGGGGGGGNDPPPAAPKMPIGVERKMQQKVQKAAMPEGDHALPTAGLIFFPYRGKASSIKSMELVYDGAAGKATLQMQ